MKAASALQLLFVTYGGGHAHMIHPVVHALRRSEAHRQGRLRIEVLALPAATYTIRAHDIACLGFGDFLDPATDADALAWGRKLAGQHHSPTIGVALEDSIAYLGLNYKDLVTRYGEAEAAALFERKGRHAFLPLTIMDRVFDRVRPDFVVTSNSPRSEAAAIATANARGVDNLIMTDLFSGLGDYRMRGKHITFLNEVARDMFVADGLADAALSRFHLTGNPAFDKLLAMPDPRDPAWMAKQFPGAGGNRTVLHADMPAWWDAAAKRSHFKPDAETLAELDACYAACRANGVVYLVRPHPSQDRALYERWLSGKPGAWLAAECNLHELLANVDLLLARSTTVGLEAAMMGVRILQLEAARHPDLPLAAMGVAFGSRGFGSLPQEIGAALTDEAAFQAQRARALKILPSEPAAPRVARIVLNCLNLPSLE